MPSAPSGRYQSRLFNFFQQQSRRLGQQFERSFRHLQVTASWSIEAVLYPFYLLIKKATESVGKQLQADKQQRNLQLQQSQEADAQPQAPPSDDPAIKDILEAVGMPAEEMERWSGGSAVSRGLAVLGRWGEKLRLMTPLPHHPFSKVQSSHPHFFTEQHTPAPPIVRGIASNLEHRNLILVTAENEILDILTLQQQEKLQSRINDEINKYCGSWQLLDEDETKLLPEIERLLNKLTSGHKDNVYVLSLDRSTQDESKLDKLPIPYQSLVLLDTAVAQLETHALIPLSRASLELLQVVQTQLNTFFYGKQQSITKTQETLAANDSGNQTPQILGLIWGAINYFFGKPTHRKLQQTTPANRSSTTEGEALPPHPFSQATLKSLQMQSEDTADPWLTIDDLFGDSQPVTEVTIGQELVTSFPNENSALPESPSSQQGLFHLFQNKIPTIKQTFGLVGRQKSTDDPTASAEAEDKEIRGQGGRQGKHFSPSPTSPSSRLQKRNQTTQVEAKPDWIEIKAKTLGYEKHILEHVLGWLDRVMLWVERVMVNIFLFFQGLLRGK